MVSDQANPWAAAFNWQRQGIEAMTEAVDSASALPDSIETMQNVEVGETPSEVVYEENKLELLHYDAEAAGIDVPEEEKEEIPILIVYALINRPYILDLQPERSVVRRLLENGHDVYLIKWNEPSRLDQHLTLDDYINRYIDNCVDEVRERSGQDAIDVLGYCMGGTMSAIYAALHPEKVNALGLMAAGLCFENSGGILEEWGSDEYYDPETITDTFGNVPSEYLDIGFALMDPIDNYVSKYIRFAENIENEGFVENFGRMERWLSEGVDVAGDTYVEFLDKIYQSNDLYHNRLEIGGEHVDLDNIDMPVLQLMGEYDHLVPASASKPFNDVIASDDVETIEYSTGHIGLSVSSSSHEDVWPRASEWFSERNRLALQAQEAEEADGAAAETGEDEAVDIEIESPEEAAAEAVESVEEQTDEEAVSHEDRTSEEIEQLGEEDVEETPAEPGEMEVDEDIVEDVVEETEGEETEDEEEPDQEVSVGEGEGDVAEEAAAEAEGESPDVGSVSGIGPTYADRLHEAGVETVADLSEHSAAELAEIAETSESRAQDWLDQA